MRGAVCALGAQVLAGFEPAGGVSGFILLEGEQLPPPKSKWDLVEMPKGALKISKSEAQKIGISRPSNKKFIDLEKGDLKAFARQDFKRTIEARAVGPIISGARVMVSARTDHNAFKAVAARVFRPVPEPERGIWRFAKSHAHHLLPRWGDFPEALELERWLDSMPAERQRALRAAIDDYQRTGWMLRYEDFHAFVKCELLPYFSKDAYGLTRLDAMVDRLINAPHDVTHTIAGPKIKPYLSWLKSQWSHDSSLFYAGVSPEKLQLWLDRATRQNKATVFWSDYTAFDASHNSDTWDFVESLYEPYKHDEEFQRVLRCWRAPKGRIRNLRYQAKVMNASGRDDTALANALLNGFAMYLSVTAAWCRVELREVTREHLEYIRTVLQLAVCGDDALGFLPETSEQDRKRFLEALRANLARFGFIAKAFASERYEDAVFLGHRPLPVGGRWYWARTLGRCLYKLGWQAGTRGDGTAWMRGVMQMHDLCSGHVPVLSDIARTFLRETEGYKVTEIRLDPNKPWEWMGRFGPRDYDDSTIEALARVYSVRKDLCRQDLSPTDVLVTADDVRDLCRYVREAVKAQPTVLDHWLLKHMVWVDEQ